MSTNLKKIAFASCIFTLFLYLVLLFLGVWIGFAAIYKEDTKIENYKIPKIHLPEKYLKLPQGETTARILAVHPLKRPQVHVHGDNNKSINSSRHISNVMEPITNTSKQEPRQRVKFVLGVPTVLRPSGNFYLQQTLASLINGTSIAERQDFLIVVCIGEVQSYAIQSIFAQIKLNFGAHLESGLIHVITPPRNYYDKLKTVHAAFKESKERVYWRTKQNLDYMYLMHYAQQRGVYYLQLEDDIIALPNYLNYISKFIILTNAFRLAKQREWIVCSFSQLGGIGKLFATNELSNLIKFLKIFYMDQPVDWLLQFYVRFKTCIGINIYTEACNSEWYKCWIESSQSQFQHLGRKSSLQNKTQKLRERRFGRKNWRAVETQFEQPMALLYALNQQQKLTNTYGGSNQTSPPHYGEIFFWGYLPQSSKFLLHIFEHPNTRRHYRITQLQSSSGGGYNNALLEVLTEKEATEVRKNEHISHKGFIVATQIQKGSNQPVRSNFYITDTGWPQSPVWLQAMRSHASRLSVVVALLTLICI